MYKQIKSCRICGNTNLDVILDLGEQALTGVFPASVDEDVPGGPLILVKCNENEGESCGLVQLQHTYDLNMLYGDNYGYRSGLNKSMVDHLQGKVNKIVKATTLNENDLIIDIGSNDGTTLKSYPDIGCVLLGVDPTAEKFSRYYPEHVNYIADFFNAEIVSKHYPGRKAKVVTAISMFYDLEDPLGFMKEVYVTLEEGGLFVFEQSYLPTMLERNSFDTVCHEHLEYYSMRQIIWMCDQVGFKISAIEMNDINGGSVSVTAVKDDAVPSHCSEAMALLDQELSDGLNTLKPYLEFAERVAALRERIHDFLSQAKEQGKKVCGMGASTKGNVLLQYCKLDDELLPCIGEVNAEKYGCFTPGTKIPIEKESDVLKSEPDYILILPWHFRSFFESCDIFENRRVIYPLPDFEIIEY